MEDILVIGGLGAAFAGVGIMYVVLFLMIRVINLDPGPGGKIPIYALIPKMAPVPIYDYIKRYRTQRGKDSLYRVMQFSWVLCGVGLLGVFGSKLFDLFLHQ
jgi:hypothetical protein